MNKATLLVAVPALLAVAGTGGDNPAWNRSAVAVTTSTPSISTAGASEDSVAKATYEKNCRKCHGPSGVPSKAMLKKFAKIETFDAAFFSKRSDDSITTVLAKGTKKDMKSFKDKLSPEEMKAVATYIRTFGK